MRTTPTLLTSLMRFLLGLAAILLTTLVLAAVFIAVFGWNWLRAPLERVVLQRPGGNWPFMAI